MRGERDRGRGVSEAQTGGVGGADRTDVAQRRRGGPRQISQRKLMYIIYDAALFFSSFNLVWCIQIINPRRMREGYGSHSVCVCLIPCQLLHT